MTAIAYKDAETMLYQYGDGLLVVSEEEAHSIKPLLTQPSPIHVVSNIHHLPEDKVDIAASHHLCYVGNFQADQNIDAVLHFLEHIWPSVHEQLPDLEFHVIGNQSEQFRGRFGRSGVRTIGYVEDLFGTLAQYRLLVCPLTYGAGVKGKIGDAASVGLPVVTTSVGAEGLPFINGQDILIADDPSEFAQHCLTLLTNDVLWQKMSDQSRASLEQAYGKETAIRALNAALGQPLEEERTITEAETSTAPMRENSTLMVDSVEVLHTFSIVVPTRNRSMMLKSALKSALRQNYPDFEVIVVDDGSDDDTANVVGSFSCERLRYIRQDSSGVAAARNRGIESARSSHILWLDDDDILLPDALSNHTATIDLRPSADVVYGGLEFFEGDTGNLIRQYDPEDWSSSPRLLSTLVAGCVIQIRGP